MDTTSNRQDFQELKAQLELHKTGGVVGIDVAKKKHFGTILDPVGQTIMPPFSFENSRAGFDHLLDRVKQMETRHLISQWVFGFEASGGYEKPLATYLVEHKHNVVQVNSVAVKRHREMMTGSVDKNDPKDATSIAYLIRQGFVEYYYLRSLSEEDLAGLVRLNELCWLLKSSAPESPRNIESREGPQFNPRLKIAWFPESFIIQKSLVGRNGSRSWQM